MTITDTIKTIPDTVKNELGEFGVKAQSFAQSAVGTATATYADLTKKGEQLVAKAKGISLDDVKGKGEDIVSKAKSIKVDDVKTKGEDIVSDAKETVTSLTTKKTPAAAPAAKEASAKKAPAKKAPAKKTTAKKAPAKKAPAKKA